MVLTQFEQSTFVLLRAVDVAQRLNISRAMAYRLMQQGDIPIVRVGHSVRVRSCDLEDYIQVNFRPVTSRISQHYR